MITMQMCQNQEINVNETVVQPTDYIQILPVVLLVLRYVNFSGPGHL